VFIIVTIRTDHLCAPGSDVYSGLLMFTVRYGLSALMLCNLTSALKGMITENSKWMVGLLVTQFRK